MCLCVYMCTHGMGISMGVYTCKILGYILYMCVCVCVCECKGVGVHWCILCHDSLYLEVLLPWEGC